MLTADRVLNALTPSDPREWSRGARRAFLLMLPVSGPLWCAWLAIWAAAWILAGAGLLLALVIVWAAHPLFPLLSWARDFASDMWR